MRAFIFFIFGVFCSLSVCSQPGTLDLTFDPGTAANSSIYSIAIQSNGKIIVAGNFTDFNGNSSIRICRLNTDGTFDNTFSSGTGPDAAVRKVLIQPDGKFIICGDFTTYNGTAKNRIARLNSNGSIDNTFDPGLGTNGSIQTASLQTDGKILIGGLFSSYNGTSRNYLARVNADGTNDSGFNTGTGPNGNVYSSFIQNDGKIIIGGQFTFINGFFNPQLRIARLNSDGSIDGSFANGQSSGDVWAIAVDPNGRIYIGGAFATYSGQSRPKIARLDAAGNLDNVFNTGSGGLNSNVRAIAIQPNGYLLVAGDFDSFNGVTTNHIIRLSDVGLNDNTFVPVSGANANISALVIQSDEKILIAGDFTLYDGVSRNRVARLSGCTTAQPGTISGNLITGCPGVTHTYSISPVSGADSYNWTLPSGWSGSSTSTSINATVNGAGGTISVTAYSTLCGNSSQQTLDVSDIPVPEPTICLVTVDTLSTHNIIIWEKPITSVIDSFIVYREVTSNNYQRIASVPFDSLNEFHDYGANPNITAFKYKISVIDTCGMESVKSNFHRTIHLQNLGSGNLQWTLYEIQNDTNPVIYYQIYRDDIGDGNFQSISLTVPGSNVTYTDPFYSSYPDAKYVVDVNWNISCSPFRTTVNTTRSNLHVSPSLGIENQLAHLIKIYPNPAK